MYLSLLVLQNPNLCIKLHFEGIGNATNAFDITNRKAGKNHECMKLIYEITSKVLAMLPISTLRSPIDYRDSKLKLTIYVDHLFDI